MNDRPSPLPPFSNRRQRRYGTGTRLQSVVLLCLMVVLVHVPSPYSSVVLATITHNKKTFGADCGVESSTNWIPWMQNFETDLPVLYPQTTEDVIQIIQTAREHGCHVRPVGTGHTINGFVAQKTDTDVIVVSLAEYTPPSRWNRVIHHDTMRARMSAGATQLDFVRFIRSEGYALRIFTGIHLFSLGGVYMNPSVHGQTFGEDRAASLLTGLLAIDGNGNMIEITDAENDERIKDWRGSLGLLGIVLAVEIQVKRDEGRQMVADVVDLTDNWDREFITSTLQATIEGKDSLGVFYEYRSSQMLLYTTFDTGQPPNEKELARVDEYYANVQKQNPDLAKTGGDKSGNFFANVASSLFGGSLMAPIAFDLVLDNIERLSETPSDGYILDASSLTATIEIIQAFLLCPSDCIEDGMFYDVLDATRLYFDVNQTKIFPSFVTLFRFIDVSEEPIMTLEPNLQHGRRYMSVEYSEARFNDRIDQPTSEALRGLQDKWDELVNRQASFHLGKTYGFDTLGDLPGVIPFQDENVDDRFYNAATRSAFIDRMEFYDPDGVFAAGAGLRLLGLPSKQEDEGKGDSSHSSRYDPRRSSVEESIAAITKCDREGNAECLSSCCCTNHWFFACNWGFRRNHCTAENSLPKGEECDVDCNCASQECHWGRCT